MSIKSILCIFEGFPAELNALNAAFLLANSYGANIRFLHPTYSMSEIYSKLYGKVILPDFYVSDELERKNHEQLQTAKQYITTYARDYNIPLNGKSALEHHASAAFINYISGIDEAVAAEGRVSDIIILGHEIYNNMAHNPLLISSLLGTGRPVLIMPKTNVEINKWSNEIVAIAWDGSLESSRALFNALPLIEKAEKLYVIVVREHNKSFNINDQERLSAYLQAHGITNEIIFIDRKDNPIGEVILFKAKKLGANLLVSGAYGHNRYREIILGGVTDYLLKNADLPFLLCH